MHRVIEKGREGRLAILWDFTNEPGEWAASLSEGRNKKRALGFSSMQERCGDFSSWFGAPDKQALTERLRNGWSEGAERLQEISVGEINPTSIRRKRFRSDQGDEIDMQSVWRGDLPRAWSRTRRTSRFGSRVLNIVVNVGDNHNLKADDLFWRGGSALRLADSLVEAGYAVGIYAANACKRFCSVDTQAEMCQFVELKAPDSQLDVSAMAGITAMPGWFRTQGFAGIVCAADMMGDQHDSSLGFAIHNIAPFAKMLGLQGEVIFQPPINSKDDAEQWIKDAMAQVEPKQA